MLLWFQCERSPSEVDILDAECIVGSTFYSVMDREQR